jgi:hypothetical protein
MQILLGHARGRNQIAELQARGWGRMMQDRYLVPWSGEPWGFDNCAFLYWRRGVSFDEDAFRRRLSYAVTLGRPFLGVTPDIVAGGVESPEFSWRWFSGRELPIEWPWYLAVQDGMTRRDVEGVIRGGWAGLFLGGTSSFKQRTAWIWAELAHEYGFKFHYGRAGTLRKLEHAKLLGADSLDSAFPLWTARRLQAFIEQVGDDSQARLPLTAS